MRGGIADPMEAGVHGSAYSPLHDRNDIRSADLCGSCHDIVTPAGVHLERTYTEWKATLFANETEGEQLTCGGCHMDGRDDIAASLPLAPTRRVHSHAMPGVDVALTPFPQAEAQRRLVQESLDSTLLPSLCVFELPGGTAAVSVDLENIAAGHSWPSGATHDRAAWVEVRAFRGETVIFESGVVQPGQPLKEVAASDPWLWRMGHQGYDADGNPVHLFWEIRTTDGSTLPGPTARDPSDPAWTETHVIRTYPLDGPLPTRVTMRVLLRPVALDVLDDLVDSGDLAPEVRDAMPTFELGSTVLEWNAADGLRCVP